MENEILGNVEHIFAGCNCEVHEAATFFGGHYYICQIFRSGVYVESEGENVWLLDEFDSSGQIGLGSPNKVGRIAWQGCHN